MEFNDDYFKSMKQDERKEIQVSLASQMDFLEDSLNKYGPSSGAAQIIRRKIAADEAEALRILNIFSENPPPE